MYEQLLPWEIPALENGEMCIWGAATRWTGVIGMVSNKRSREDYPPILNQLGFNIKNRATHVFFIMGAKTGGISGFLASAQAHLFEFLRVATVLHRGGDVASALIMNTDDVILSRDIVTRSGRLMVFAGVP